MHIRVRERPTYMHVLCLISQYSEVWYSIYLSPYNERNEMNVYAIVYTIVKRRNIYENKTCSWPSDAVGERPYSCRQTDYSNFPDLHDRTCADLFREESATEIKIIQNRMLLLPEIGMIALWMYRLTWLLTLCSTKCTPFNEVLQNLCLYCEKPSLAAQVPL